MSLWRRLLGGGGEAPGPGRPEPAPASLYAEGTAPLPIAPLTVWQEDLPTFDWARIHDWLNGIDNEAIQAKAFADAELAWLAHLREALGPDYRIDVQDDVVLLSSLEPVVARATLAFMRRMAQRIPRVLEGLTDGGGWGRDVLLVLDDPETYYRYVSRYYADGGTYGTSAGMWVDEGCSHFVVPKADLHAIEPTIVHEMTHAMLARLNLPTWVNEGLAVNTEHRLSPTPAGGRPLAQSSVAVQSHQRHRAYWNAERIQGFWSGELFLSEGTGQELSYHLATLLVGQLAVDWPRFAAFALAAQRADGGQAAAHEHVGMGLGALLGVLFRRDDGGAALEPQPALWQA